MKIHFRNGIKEKAFVLFPVLGFDWEDIRKYVVIIAWLFWAINIEITK